MKKLLSIIIALFCIITLSSCGQTETQQETRADEKYENVCVDIGVNEDGYYGLMADVEIHRDTDGELGYIYIENPALLAFCVSSKWDGGVYILKQTEGNEIIDTLTEIAETLETAGNSELADQLNEVISTLGYSGPITKAST